jgi:hypothetical protein
MHERFEEARLPLVSFREASVISPADAICQTSRCQTHIRDVLETFRLDQRVFEIEL